MFKNQIKKVVIVGGTHGNEFTGVYLAKYWLQNPKLVKRDGFETSVVFANQKAFKEVRRYIDRDLNRSCSHTILQSVPVLHEEKLAHKLNSIIGQKGDNKTNADFVVDLHTTTSNMGLSLVISNNSELTWMAASYLKKEFPNLNIYRWQGDEEGAFVDSLGSSGFAIEVGAIPQGVLRADIYNQTKDLVYKLLDFLENPVKVDREVEIYDHVRLVDFPRDENGELIGMVHASLQDNDYILIKNGDTIFELFDGNTILYDCNDDLHALFINEAAYYEKGFAFCLARKVTYSF